MSHSAFGLGFTIFNVFAALTSILVAASIVRWGIRKTFGIGSALILLGALWLSLIASRPWHYWVGLECSRQRESVSAPSSLQLRRSRAGSAAIEEERWPSLIRIRICRVFRFAADQSDTCGQWGKLAPGVGDGCRHFVLSAIVAFLFVKERPEELGQSVDGGPGAAQPAGSPAARKLVTAFPWEPRQAYRTLSYWMILVALLPANSHSSFSRPTGCCI